jgi:hypothetical protein
VDRLLAALAVDCDIIGCISYPIPGPVLMPPCVHTNSISEDSGFTVYGQETRFEKRVVPACNAVRHGELSGRPHPWVRPSRIKLHWCFGWGCVVSVLLPGLRL